MRDPLLGSEVQNMGLNSSSQPLAQDIAFGLVNTDSKAYGGGLLESGGRTPPIDVTQHADFSTSSDDDKREHASSSLSKESRTIFDDKAHLEHVKLYESILC
jgi:hypothetical protein